MKRFVLSVCASAVILASASMVIAEEKPKKERDPEAAFKRLDKDGDQKVTEAEFIGKREGEKAEMAKKQFARLDKDQSKFLTLEEFKSRGKKPKSES